MACRTYLAATAAAALLFLNGCHSQTPTALAETEPSDAQQPMPVYNVAELTTSCNNAIQEAQERANALALLPLDTITVKTFLEPWDKSGAAIENVLGPIYLQSYVHPDEAVRSAGERCILQVTKFRTALFQNEALYKRLNALQLSPNEQAASHQLHQDLQQAFIKSGVALPPKKRQRAAEINETIERLAQGFQRRLRDNNSAIYFDENEITGMSEAWQDSHKQADGRYKASFDYPDFFPFMRNADNANARKRYYLGFTTRGGAENIRLLDEIVALRQELAALHGQPSFAHLVTQNRMLNHPEKINAFLDEVATAIQALEQTDIDQLSATKAISTQQTKAQLERWDTQYYLEKTRQQRYSIDQEALREYFPSGATLQWALSITQQLLGINIRPAKAPTWHKDVEYYDVYDSATNDYLGAIYLDLYPRDGKYKHAAAFPVRSGSRLLGQRPSSALVTNFSREGFTQNELETLLHELGHVFHGVLSQTWYASHSGTEVKRDFVEAPSQMLEAWARSYETLSTVRDFCEDCPGISKQMVQQLNNARTFGQGIFYARQHLYASYDMALASGSHNNTKNSALALWQKMESASVLGHVPGTEFPGTFGHIAGGYAAGYYGYMWSEVLALDMQSLFGKNLMNPALGRRYRDEILAKGGEAPPAQLVETFLGRAPNSAAFFSQFTSGN